MLSPPPTGKKILDRFGRRRTNMKYCCRGNWKRWHPISLLVILVSVAFTLTFAVGCHGGSSETGEPPTFALPPKLPELSAPLTVEAGITVQRVRLIHGATHTDLLVFLPPHTSGGKLACLFIAPAGTRLFHGSVLDDGNPPEYMPYLRAGYAVVAYELAGDLPEHFTDRQLVAATTSFKNANGGLSDARVAMDYALAKVPVVDPDRLYAAGHSSAATVALYVAANDPRVKACIAYAPACHLSERLGSRAVSALNEVVPGFHEFIQRISPDANAPKLHCPVFLFHADDDSNVHADDIDRFAEQLKPTNAKLTYVTVPSGGHYQSMIDEGLPRAVQWLKRLP